jgi:mannosyltransferase OCH1-like enzyme
MSWIDTNIPQKMQLVIDKNRELNPEFNFFIYSDDACRDYIRRNFEKEVVDAFDTLVPGAYKSDLWRYCILYKEGGVYMDIKMECKVPFSRLIKQQPITLVADLPHTYAVSITTGIWNGFMIYPPKNNVFRSCIDKIIENCNTKEYGRSPLDITGPHLIGDIVELEYPGQIKYKTLKMHTDGVTIMTLYDNEPILRTYKEYRNDQKKFGKKAHYSDYYWNHRVYLGE